MPDERWLTDCVTQPTNYEVNPKIIIFFTLKSFPSQRTAMQIDIRLQTAQSRETVWNPRWKVGAEERKGRRCGRRSYYPCSWKIIEKKKKKNGTI